ALPPRRGPAPPPGAAARGGRGQSLMKEASASLAAKDEGLMKTLHREDRARRAALAPALPPAARPAPPVRARGAAPAPADRRKGRRSRCADRRTPGARRDRRRSPPSAAPAPR